MKILENHHLHSHNNNRSDNHSGFHHWACGVWCDMTKESKLKL